MKDLPFQLLKSLKNVDGFDEEAFKSVHQSGEQITSIRLNPNKYFDVKEHFQEVSKVPWCEHGFYLKQRPSFTADPLFHAGAYYVQEASSMFLEQIIKQTCDVRKEIKVLDLCAAPGGKSTHIQSLITPQSLLVSNEIIQARVNVLADNITKWGAANVIITNNDPADFAKTEILFDVIVIDAPCSGSGLFRKDPNAIDEWSLNNVELCSIRQQKILSDILPVLKPGGLLVYSTCSFSEMENERIADELVSNHHLKSININIEKFDGIFETSSPETKAFGYRFYPDKIKGEGFFVAAFRKEVTSESDFKRSKWKDQQISIQAKSIAEQYIINASEYAFVKHKDDIVVLPIIMLDDFYNIQKHLYIKKAGVNMGSIIRDELIPSHALAVSNILADKIPSVEVSTEIALEYLRKKDFKIDIQNIGWVLINYKNHRLGFIKNMQNRMNNYYPKELRILNK